VLVATALAGLAAGAAGAFPLEGRMALWLVPVVVVGLAGAAAGVSAAVPGAVDRLLRMDGAAHRDMRRRGWGTGVAVIVGLALIVQGPVRQVGSVAHDPTTWIDLRPLLQAVRSKTGPGDLVWVHTDDAPSAAYYAVATGVAPTSVLSDGTAAGDCRGTQGLASVAAGHRVWFVFGYRSSRSIADAESAINARLAAVAHLAAEVHRPQATAWLWDFGVSPDAAGVGPLGSQLACVSLTPASPPSPTGLSTGPLGTGRPT
jgi:hypothetical protein